MINAIERSSWSRHGDILEVGDVSKEEALQYLQLRKIDAKKAAQIYELVGGRMIHLKTLADANTKFESMCSISMENRLGFSPFFTDLRIDMLRDSKTQLEIANVLPKQRYHKEGATIIRELLEKGSMSSKRYFDLLDPEVGDTLLETNVFAQHFASRTITFQSTLMARVCEQKFADWKEESKDTKK